MVLLNLTSLCASSQQTQQAHVLLNVDRALVTQIDVSPGGTYALTKDQEGDVWIAIDPLVIVIKRDVSKAQSGFFQAGRQLSARVKSCCSMGMAIRIFTSLSLNQKKHIKSSLSVHSF
jgi:hypothetical protein